MTEPVDADQQITEAEVAVAKAQEAYVAAERKRTQSDPTVKAKKELDTALANLAVLEAQRKRAVFVEEEKTRAHKLKEASAALRELGPALDEIGEDLVKHSHALLLGARELRQAGGGVPTDDQCLMLWRSLNGYLTASIWHRNYQRLAPSERPPFSHFINIWCDSADRSADAVLRAIEQQPKSEEAA
jgi:hypothetical protein